MLNQAIKKIEDEMKSNKSDATDVVGHFIIQHLRQNPASAEMILKEGKTISGGFAEMRKVAEKKKKGNFYAMSEIEGFNIVLQYFGIIAKVEPGSISVETAAVAPTKAEVQQKPGFDISVDEFF